MGSWIEGRPMGVMDEIVHYENIQYYKEIEAPPWQGPHDSDYEPKPQMIDVFLDLE
jgi:hypothetical protein